MKKSIYLYIIIVLLFAACSSKNCETVQPSTNKYSSGFSISTTENGYSVTTDNGKNAIELSRSANGDEIQIPVKSVVCFSTTYTAFISQLGENQSIKGISGCKYVCNDSIQSFIKNGKIAEIGYDQQIDMEKIIALKPEVVFAFGVDNQSLASFTKLEKTGIKIIYVNDYTESQPLGRTEWIKFFGCFYDKYDQACEYFDSVENRYLEIKNRAKLVKPKVLVSLPWKGTWWCPGGNSFFANFVKDAGGDYIFDNQETTSQPYSIEHVFSQANEAEIWLHPNEKTTREEILQVDKRIANFLPYKTAKVYNNNKIMSEAGGSDFWESGIVHPDIILEDLCNIFQNTEGELHYYVELK